MTLARSEWNGREAILDLTVFFFLSSTFAQPANRSFASARVVSIMENLVTGERFRGVLERRSDAASERSNSTMERVGPESEAHDRRC